MSDKLKACPFCGNKAVLTHVPPGGTPYRMGDDGLYIVCCYDDECCGSGKSGGNVDEVIKAWNTRPLEDALQSEIERLREAQRWIPVGERLPEEPIDDDVSTFICLIRGISFYGDVYHSTRALRYYNEKFYSIGHFSTDWTDQVVAWMPLPEPPQEDEG